MVLDDVWSQRDDVEAAKEEWRRQMQRRSSSAEPRWGKAAERLRRLDSYRRAQTVMASLDKSLFQVRLNALNDAKRLVVPSPGLRKGFMLLNPKDIPVRRRAQAVHAKGCLSFGISLVCDTLPVDAIALMATEALAAGDDGSRLGDGSGCFDVQYAILDSLGWLDPDVCVVAVVGEDRVVSHLPMEETDVPVNRIVTPERSLEIRHGGKAAGRLVWHLLPMKRIRRSDILFDLWKKKENPR